MPPIRGRARQLCAPFSRPARGSRPSEGSGSSLTIEQIVAIEAPRDFRLHPRERLIAYTAEAAGARQLFVLAYRAGAASFPTQLTASEKGVSEPQWSPDGRRVAFVRDGAIWTVELDGSRQQRVSEHPAGNSMPRWSPDGRRLAFISRRRGWSQVWLLDAPLPRRGRPAAAPKAPDPKAVSPAGVDVEDYAWSPDAQRLAIVALRPSAGYRERISIVSVSDAEELPIPAPDGAWELAPHWLADGSLLFVSDAEGWVQVVRLSPDGSSRTVLTAGERDHGEVSGAPGYGPVPSPDGRRFVHAEMHDALVALVVAPLAGTRGGQASQRGKPRPASARSRGGSSIQPWSGVWRTVGWTPDGQWVAAMGEGERAPQDLWLLPVPGAAPSAARPRQLTQSLPAVLGPVVRRFLDGERVSIPVRDGLQIPGTLWRPAANRGRGDGKPVPAVVYPHGGPTWQAYRSWQPFKQLLVAQGMAFLDVDFRGSTGYGREFRDANVGDWGHTDVQDIIDAGRWLQQQPWCDGRLAVYGGSYGGYLTLSALVEEPAMWKAGVDLYGDSEIAESYRHGDRVGRLDLERMMGSPDGASQAERYRRGSPVYRAERIEAPLLILHGRKDKRVVPLMSEKMVEALEIEDKHHEVHWYDDEGHGWERRENRRDAFTRIRDFLKRYLLEEAPPPD
ncbi:MAG: S9 family peptidase [Chloroflexi bacterium]|nr:MAG: S9 family peptidase [Chloroflexota bacterium]